MRRFALFVMVPASVSKIILMGCLTTPIREPANSPTSTSLSSSARTVITVLYVFAPTVESRFRDIEHFATATPLCSVASRKKTAKKKSKKTKEKQTKVQVQQSNWRLKVAQQKLQVLGFSDERPSGRMTEATSTALKSFQKQHKLKADGELNDATYQKLTWENKTKKCIPKVKGKEIVSRAAKYKGVPYVFGGTTTKGFDCSGYVLYVFKDCKAKLPRLADEQALQGIFVTQKQLRPGDLVFFTTYAAGASHVGIYAGDGQFWSASSSKGVILSSLKDDYWKQRYYGARRVLITNGEVYK